MSESNIRVTVITFAVEGKGEDCHIAALANFGCRTTPGHAEWSTLLRLMLTGLSRAPLNSWIAGKLELSTPTALFMTVNLKARD